MSDNGHIWIERFNLICCQNCGLVRRADGTSNPCKGRVKLALRDSDAAATAAINGDLSVPKDQQARASKRYRPQ